MVLADGTFDPLHCGHIRYLKAAAAIGRPLMVNLAPDAMILAKGRKPFQTLPERAETIAALRMVDSFSMGTLPEAIRRWHPSVLVKGKDWKGHLPREVLKACEEHGVKIMFTDTQTRSSSERLNA